MATGTKACDLESKNKTRFTFDDDTPRLGDPTSGGKEGTLTITNGSTVPPNTFSVGVGMSGKGTYVVNAGPNLKHQFTPEPAYYVAAIDQVVEGQVMDIQTITQAGELKFSDNQYGLVATLKGDNTWDIKPPAFQFSQTGL